MKTKVQFKQPTKRKDQTISKCMFNHQVVKAGVAFINWMLIVPGAEFQFRLG